MAFENFGLIPKHMLYLYTFFIVFGHVIDLHPRGNALAYSHLREPERNAEEKALPWRAGARGPCHYKRCGAGKICQESSGVAHCNCVGECQVRNPKAVCGTDGRFYTSLCELRRTACLSGERIFFSHYYQHEPHSQRDEDLKEISRVADHNSADLPHCHHHHLHHKDKNTKSYGESSKTDHLSYPQIRADTSDASKNDDHSKTKQQRHLRPARKNNFIEKRRHDLPKGERRKIMRGHPSKDKAEDKDEDVHENFFEDSWKKRSEMSDEAIRKETKMLETGGKYRIVNKDGQRGVDSDDHHQVLNPPVKSSSFSTNKGQSSSLEQSLKESVTSASPSGTSFAKVCSPQDYEKLKASIFQLDMAELMKHLNAIITSVSDDIHVPDDGSYQSDTMLTSPSEGDGPEADKDNLLRKIFNALDSNHDSILEYVELYKAVVENKLGFENGECDLRDFLLFDDTDHDGQLHVNEFFSSFSHFYDITMISLDKALELKEWIVVEGESVHLSCDIRGSPPPYIKWKRYQINVDQLGIAEIKEDVDGSLIIENVHMSHGGQYSCQSPRNPEVVQTHIIIVETIPYVTITPKASWKRPGQDFLLSCSVAYPISNVKLTWLFNGIRVNLPKLSSGSENNKYILENSSNGVSRLRIKEIYFQNMGSYSCQVENKAGVGIATASLVVIDPNSKPEVQALHNTNAKQLLVFHRSGLASYSLEDCGWLWEIFGDDDILEKESDMGRTQVCDQFHGICHWQGGVQVGPNYVYALQPEWNKLVLIDVGALNSVGNALESVETCGNPERLEYVPYTDQLWIVCEKSISILENASKEQHQRRKAIQFPVEEVNGMARIYLPAHQTRLGGRKECHFGHVWYKQEEKVLRKIDLKTYQEEEKLNLTKYRCIPNQIYFSISCTTIIINCEEKAGSNGQLVVDVLSNSVRFKTEEISGSSIQSGDGRILLTEKHVGNTTHVFVQRVGVYDVSLLSHFLIPGNISSTRIIHSTLTDAYASVAKLESGKEGILSLQIGELESVDDLANFVPHNSQVSLYSVENAFSLKMEHVVIMDAETLTPRCKFYEDIPELQSLLVIQS